MSLFQSTLTHNEKALERSLQQDGVQKIHTHPQKKKKKWYAGSK